MIIGKAEASNAIEIFKRAGGQNQPVVFITDTIYGIGAPISDKKANDKIFDIKGRDRTKPFPVLVSSVKQAKDIAFIENDMQERVIENLWPGPFTLILKAKPQLENLYTINGTIALRMPDKEWLLELINFTGPLSATSANPSGAEYINEEEKIVDSFGKKVNYFIFGKNIENSSSSIIDITKDAPIVLRSGSVEPDIKLMVK